MLAEIFEDLRGVALEAALAAAGALLGQERHGTVEADRENLIDVVEVGVSAVVQNERSIAAEPGRDRRRRFRM